MSIAIIGLIVLTLIDLIGLAGGEFPGLMLGMLAITGVGWIGVVLAAAGQRKAGAYMVAAAGLIHVPIGLIAAFGAKKLLDEHDRDLFEAQHGAL